MGETSILKELKADKIKEVFQNTESKFIYFYSKSQLSLEELPRVEEFAKKLMRGMHCVSYKINLDENFDALADYLKQRNPKTADTTVE